jgi:hypothetical protein
MAVALRQSRRFSASSPVARYWVANCIGFAVTGGARGTVEAVQAESDPNAPDELVVRCGRRRTRVVPASAVRAVVPADRVLIVDHVPRAVEVQGTRAARAAGRATSLLALVVARLLGWLCRRGWRLACRAWTAAAPHAAAGARRGWSGTRRGVRGGARLVASVPWQRFGPSARSATTSLWQGRSRRSSRRRTTSSPPTPESDSGHEAPTTSST